MVGVALYCVLRRRRPTSSAQIRGDALATLGVRRELARRSSRTRDYFALFSAPSPLNHTWSLAIEEQFYVDLAAGLRRPARVVETRRRRRPCSSTSLVLARGVERAHVRRCTTRRTSTASYFGTDTRAAAILFGAALAAWLAIHGPTTNRARRVALEVLGVVGASVLAVAWTRLDGQSSTLYHGGFLLCGLAATAVIAAAVHPEPGPCRTRSVVPTAVRARAHQLRRVPLPLADRRRPRPTSGCASAAGRSSSSRPRSRIGVAIASYRLVEQPIRTGRTDDRATAQAHAGDRDRTRPGHHRQHPGSATGAYDLGPEASTAGGDQAFDSAPPNAKRVMIVGDSVAYFLGQSMKTIHTNPPIWVFNAGTEGCTFPPQATKTRRFNSYYRTVTIQRTFGCDPRWEAGAITRFKPDIIFWFINSPADAVLVHGGWLETCSAAYASLYEQSLRKELTILGAHGAKVAFTTEVYPRYLFAEQDGHTDCENRVRRKVAAETKVQLIDLLSYVCPHGRCQDKKNGVTLRPDGEHYEGAGGQLVSKWLLEQLEPPSIR